MGFPNWLSQIDQLLTPLYISKECNLKFTKGSPPRVAKFQAIVVLTNVWCSSIFYVWVSAADSWWQPKQASKKKRKAKVGTGTEENTSEHPLKKNASRTFGSQLWYEKGISQIDQFLTTLHMKRMQFEVHKGSPPTSCQISGNHCIDKCMMFIHILCMGFCSW